MTAVAERGAIKLNQIIAARTGIKGDADKKLTKHHHILLKNDLFGGMVRTYKPRDDDDYRFPDETTNVVMKAKDILQTVGEDLTDLFDVTAVADWTNQTARADVVLLGGDQPVTLLADVPVAYLMFLEKQLVNIETLIRKLPTLTPTEVWTFDPDNDVYRSEPAATTKTKKVLRNHVKAAATERHPAQVDVYTEDVPIGTWTTVKFSGALPASQINKMLNRVTALSKAVKYAREQANMADVVPASPGKKIFDYLFAPDE
jgi:hypothetical protein